MAESIQQPLDGLLTFFLEEQVANKAHQDDLNTKFEALSGDSTNSTQEGNNHSHTPKAKGVMGQVRTLLVIAPLYQNLPSLIFQGLMAKMTH